MKTTIELQKIAKEVINLLAEKQISINEASFVLEETEKIIRMETTVTGIPVEQKIEEF